MNIQNNIFGIILAGGSGSRLWPLSREMYPKQLLALTGEQSLFQLTHERLKQFISAENIMSVTNDKHVCGIKIQMEKEPKHKIIGEPLARNTAPAIGLAFSCIKKNYTGNDDPVIIVCPSDHLIKDDEKFIEAVMQGAEIAKQGYIVTFGIKPTKPETGYGYIKTFSDQKIGKTGLKTECFREKPDYDTAVEYVKSGDYFWNSGIFMFSLSTIIKEFEKFQPELINGIEKIDIEDKNSLKQGYEKLPSISIDYAVMEKSDKIVLIPAEFDWNDLGSWDSIYEVCEKDENNNVVKGHVHSIDSENSLIYSSSRFVSTIGIKDTLVVETDDAVLVCNRHDSQKVKSIFDALKAQDSELFKAHKTVITDWGSYTTLTKTDNHTVIEITLKKDCVLTLDSDEKSSKHCYITEGKAKLNTGEVLHSGQSLDIKPSSTYSIENPEATDLKIIEITAVPII